MTTVAKKKGMQETSPTYIQSHIDSIHSPHKTRNTIIKECMKSVKFHLGNSPPGKRSTWSGNKEQTKYELNTSTLDNLHKTITFIPAPSHWTAKCSPIVTQEHILVIRSKQLDTNSVGVIKVALWQEFLKFANLLSSKSRASENYDKLNPFIYFDASRSTSKLFSAKKVCNMFIILPSQWKCWI